MHLGEEGEIEDNNSSGTINKSIKQIAPNSAKSKSKSEKKTEVKTNTDKKKDSENDVINGIEYPDDGH